MGKESEKYYGLMNSIIEGAAIGCVSTLLYNAVKNGKNNSKKRSLSSEEEMNAEMKYLAELDEDLNPKRYI